MLIMDPYINLLLVYVLLLFAGKVAYSIYLKKKSTPYAAPSPISKIPKPVKEPENTALPNSCFENLKEQAFNSLAKN